MDKQELKNRTQEFAIRIVKLGCSLPKTNSGFVLSKQIVRSGTSVGANYRAALVARSDKEFISKLNIVLEEADETCYWLEILIRTKLVKEKLVSSLYEEAKELAAIFASTLKTMNKKMKGN